MYVDEDKMFCFIAHPRTASRATGKALGLPYFERTGHHNFDPAKCNVWGGGDIFQWVVACAVRNPFDIVVSWYHNEHFNEKQGRHKKGEFLPWIKTTLLRQNQWLRCDTGKDCWGDDHLYFYGLPVCNYVIRYERMEESLKELCDRVGLRYVPTEPYGVLPRERDYRTFYDDEAIEIVLERFSSDFKLTGYTFDER